MEVAIEEVSVFLDSLSVFLLLIEAVIFAVSVNDLVLLSFFDDVVVDILDEGLEDEVIVFLALFLLVSDHLIFQPDVVLVLFELCLPFFVKLFLAHQSASLYTHVLSIKRTVPLPLHFQVELFYTP